MKRFIGFVVVFLVLMGARVTPAHAADFTVCATGCDHTTIAAAIAAARNGDTITVMDAVHTEQGITVNKNLTIQGLGAKNTIVQAHASPNTATDRVFYVTAYNVNVTFQNITIRHGKSSTDGGGIYSRGALLVINNSTISGNTAAGDGGGIYGDVVDMLQVNNSTISGNTATDDGGGLYNWGSVVVQVNNSTFSGNSAANGGAIYHWGSGAELTAIHNTFSGNSATTTADGISMWGAGAIMDLRGNILANATSGADECYEFGTTITTNNNLIKAAGSNDCGVVNGVNGNIVGIDPALGLLQDNGGPTMTHKPNSGSAAIDAGGATCGVTVDQRGAARPYNGACDIGAVEVRETISAGSCGGSDLTGLQTFNFASGNTVTIYVDTADGSDGLKCISVEEMGRDHLIATGSTGNPGISTGNWWHITGNIDSGFDVDITLPWASANASSRVCKFPGNSGGAGWDCGALDGTGTTYVGGSSVTRLNRTGFSDWAVGQQVNPTAVSLQSISTTSSTTIPVLLLVLLLMGGLTAVYTHRRTR